MDYNNKSETYYSNLRTDMLKYIGDDAGKVLEVGCGNGILLDYLKKNKFAEEVWGVDLNANNQYGLENFFQGKIEDVLNNIPKNYFDTIICNDVLEHLADPSLVLKILITKLNNSGRIVASIPNIRHVSSLIGLIIRKDFKYTHGGIMDFTHLRFFTKKSINRLFVEHGLSVVKLEGISCSPIFLKKFLTNILAIFLGQDIKYAQFAIIATKLF